MLRPDMLNRPNDAMRARAFYATLPPDAEAYILYLEGRDADLRREHARVLYEIATLTPGGSEFHQEADSCIDYARSNIESKSELLVKQFKRATAAERRNAHIATAFMQLVSYLSSIDVGTNEQLRRIDELSHKVLEAFREKEEDQCQAETSSSSSENTPASE